MDYGCKVTKNRGQNKRIHSFLCRDEVTSPRSGTVTKNRGQNKRIHSFYVISHIALVISLRARHSFLVSAWVVKRFSHGARMSRLPCEHASMNSPPGLVNVVKLIGEMKMRGRWASRAALMTAFSPGLIEGDTSTAHPRASSRYSTTAELISCSLRRREHCTCRFTG